MAERISRMSVSSNVGHEHVEICRFESHMRGMVLGYVRRICSRSSGSVRGTIRIEMMHNIRLCEGDL